MHSKSAVTKTLTIALIAIIVIAAVAVAGYYFFLMPKAPTQVELSILLTTSPETDALIDVSFPAYEKTHPNVKIVYENSPRDVWPEKKMREYTEKKGVYDIIWNFMGTMPAGCTLGAFVPLDNYSITQDAVDGGKTRFVAGPDQQAVYETFLVANAKYPINTGNMYMMPITYWNTVTLFYRNDLLTDPTEMANFKAKYGYDLKVPENWKELYDEAEFFTRPDKDLYGFWMEAKLGDHMVPTEFASFLFSNGGQFAEVDAQGNNHILVANTECVEAFSMMVNMTKFAPPGWESSTFFEGSPQFEQGKLAFMYCWQYMWPDLWNQTLNLPTYGKCGWASPALGPHGTEHAAWLSGGGLSITVGSKNKDEAAKFLAWLDSYDQIKAQFMAGYLGTQAGRMDVTNDPECMQKVNTQPIKYGFQNLKMPPPDVLAQESLYDRIVPDLVLRCKNGEITPAQAMEEYRLEIIKYVPNSY